MPEENVIWEVGKGFNFAMNTLNGGRIGIASQAVGIAEGALEVSTKYAKIRKAFGTEIAHHQAIQFKLADMSTKVEAAKLLTLQAAALKMQAKNTLKNQQWRNCMHLKFQLNAPSKLYKFTADTVM